MAHIALTTPPPAALLAPAALRVGHRVGREVGNGHLDHPLVALLGLFRMESDPKPHPYFLEGVFKEI